MRPCNSEFELEDEYISRNNQWSSQWHIQKYTDFTEFEMPKQAPLALAPPERLELALVVATVFDNMQIVESAPKRSCNDSLQVAVVSNIGSSNSNILEFLLIPRNVDGVATELGFVGNDAKKKANKILYQLRAAGKIMLVSGWGLSPSSTGKPMWQTC